MQDSLKYHDSLILIFTAPLKMHIRWTFWANHYLEMVFSEFWSMDTP